MVDSSSSRRGGGGRSGLTRRIGVLIVMAFAAAGGFGVSALAASASANISGTWTCCGSGGAGAQQWSITESGSGSLSGSGLDETGAVFGSISGSVSGNNVTIVTTYNSFDSGYVATFTGTLFSCGTAMSGSWESNADQSGTWTATLASGATTTTTTTTTATTTTPSRRPSATRVFCTYTLADATDVCIAVVGDASGQAGLPTGTVVFTSAPGSTFSAGGSCTLQQQPGDVGVTSCSVSYYGSNTQSLQVTAAYPGDSTFQPSSGSTQYLVAGERNSVYAPTIQAFNPPTLNTTADSPANGSTISATGAVTSDLTEGAVCEAGTNTESGGDAAVASTAAAKARGLLVVRDTLVRRHLRRGKVKLSLHFTRAALLRAFPAATRVQLVITVKITPPHGRSVTTFRREVLTLRLGGRSGRLAAADAVNVGSRQARSASGSSNVWSGNNGCGTFTATAPVASTRVPIMHPEVPVTIAWVNPVAACTNPDNTVTGPAKAGWLDALDNIPATSFPGNLGGYDGGNGGVNAGGELTFRATGYGTNPPRNVARRRLRVRRHPVPQRRDDIWDIHRNRLVVYLQR